MKHLLILFSFFVVATSAAEAPKFPSCECPSMTCPPCTHSEGQTFYSEKCGEDGIKTRSCARPKCVDNDDPKCVKPTSAAPAVAAPVKEAQVGATDSIGRVIGAVKVVKGSVQIVRGDGVTKSVVVGDGLHERDRIITEKEGGALLEFEGGNKVHVQADTRMTIQEYDNAEENKRAVFNLLKGKIRNQVKQKYNGKQSRFEVITPGVVAGVRGTDFVVSQEKTDHMVTRFDTLEGSVYLQQRLGEKVVKIDRDESITYSLDDVDRASNDWSNKATQGFFNPVRKLTEIESQTIARATDLAFDPVAAKAGKKKVDPIICKSPSGRLNQCAWQCENNPKRAKACMVNKPNVACVRSRCNANGEWAESTKLPAGAATACGPAGARVGDCDY